MSMLDKLVQISKAIKADREANPELHALLDVIRDEVAWELDAEPLLRKIGEAILAAGYSKPRTIETVEELDALPIKSVVLDRHGEAYQRIDDEGMGGEALWCAGDLVTSSLLDLPVTVLHEPAP